MSHEDVAELEEQAGELNITTNEGTDFALLLTWKDELDNPVDVTGYTGRMQIRDQAHTCGNLIHDMTTENGGVLFGGTNGEIRLIIPRAENVFGDSKYYYDLELFDPSDKAFKLLRGSFSSIAEVTADG